MDSDWDAHRATDAAIQCSVSLRSDKNNENAVWTKFKKFYVKEIEKYDEDGLFEGTRRSGANWYVGSLLE